MYSAVISEPAAKVKATDRFPGLDGLRALAMLSVFLFHAWLPVPRMIFTTWHPLPGVTWRGNSLVANLNTGVAIFFALSGFLIYRPFAAAHIEDRCRPDVVRYARRRALRIYPAYWLAFFVFLASGEFVHITTTQVAVNLGLVQSWFAFSERPSTATLLGGAVVVAAVAVQAGGSEAADA